jgi:hypothetical protein
MSLRHWKYILYTKSDYGISCFCYYVYYWIKKRAQQMREYVKYTTNFSYNVITKKKV